MLFEIGGFLFRIFANGLMTLGTVFILGYYFYYFVFCYLPKQME